MRPFITIFLIFVTSMAIGQKKNAAKALSIPIQKKALGKLAIVRERNIVAPLHRIQLAIRDVILNN